MEYYSLVVHQRNAKAFSQVSNHRLSSISKGCHSKPELLDQGHLSAWFALPIAKVVLLHTNSTGSVGKSGSTRFRLESPKPTHAPVPTLLFGHETFFTLISWVGTRDPVLGSLPRNFQSLQGMSDAIVTDLARSDAFRKTDFGS